MPPQEVRIPLRRNVPAFIYNEGILPLSMQLWGQTPRQVPQPIQEPVMKYPSCYSNPPPKVKPSHSMGFLERSNHSTLIFCLPARLKSASHVSAQAAERAHFTVRGPPQTAFADRVFLGRYHVRLGDVRFCHWEV